MSTRVAADTSDLERLYFDASHWNRLCDHPHRAEIIAAFDHSKRAVFPSVINAAELLNTGKPQRRADLCGVMASLQRDNLAVLGHPEAVLEKVAADFVRGKPSVTLGEGPAQTLLRRLVGEPRSASDEDRALLRGWTDAMKDDLVMIRSEFAEIFRDAPFAGEASVLPLEPSFSALLFEKVPSVRKAATSSEQVYQLIQGTAPWAAFAASVAYEFRLHQPGISADEKSRAPGGPDMRQLTYMGLMNRFVLTDRGLIGVAKWVADLLPGGMIVDVIQSRDYFDEIGFPVGGAP